MKHKAKLDTDKPIRKWLDADTYIENGIKYQVDIHGISHKIKKDKELKLDK